MSGTDFANETNSVPLDATRPHRLTGHATEPENATPPALAQSALLAPGRLIDDKFKLKRQLGSGGMAQVMLAEDLTLGRDVALKFLGVSLLDDPTWRDRFALEARNMAKVRHENVAQVFSYGIYEGWPYIVMEYVAGTTLADWIRTHPSPPLADVAAIVMRIAEGLTAIHAAGLIHHDIKPANVMVEESGRVVVTDLGLSCVVSGFAAPQATSGTPRYMAPEQMGQRPIPPALAVRTDVYQLGITTFELLVGSVPFDAVDPVAVFRLHRDASPPRPSMLRPQLSDAVDRVILKALEKNMRLRHATPLAFAEALQSAVAPQASRPPSVARRPLRVLVADDEPEQLNATCALLALGLEKGSSVQRASDGAKALSAAQHSELDVLVLDLHMPVMSGLDVAAALAKSTGRRPRIIVISGLAGVEDWRNLRELGVDAMLLKPFNADQLIATIEHLAAGATH